MKVFAAVEGNAVAGNVYFAGGGPAQNVEGRITSPEGREVASFRTDAQGNFRAEAADPSRMVVSVDGGDGHAARLALGGEDEAPAPAGSSDSARMEQALARQLAPLRLQLDQMEARARFSDIVGGVGLIFGLCGVGAWAASRRRGRAQ